MATATHTQFGSRTRLTVTGTLTSYGAGTRLPIETTGASSLVQVLRVKLQRTAGTAATVDYTCPQRWAWIEPGDLFTVTDPDLAWSERLCLVQSRAWASDGSVRYTLRVLEG